MSGSGTVIAVNTDATAPIVAHADYTANVDMFELLDALEDLVATAP
jgi:electron transfer flavoprotein alpha subunit